MTALYILRGLSGRYIHHIPPEIRRQASRIYSAYDLPDTTHNNYSGYITHPGGMGRDDLAGTGALWGKCYLGTN